MYAGEEIECIITFKNIAQPPEKARERETANAPTANGERGQSIAPQTGAHSRRSSIVQGIGHAPPSRAASVSGVSQKRGHKPALSLNVLNGATGRQGGGLQSAPVPTKTPNSAVKGHARSLSIMSYGSDAQSDGRTPVAGPGLAAKRGGKVGHGRSTSLQYIPKPAPMPSPNPGVVSPRNPSPLYESTTPSEAPGQSEPIPIRPARRRPGTASAGTTPQLGRSNSLHKSTMSGTFNQDFQFPRTQQQQQPRGPSPQPDRPRPSRSPSMMHSAQPPRPISPRPPPEGLTGNLSNLNPISRVMSETSTAGTPRSSGEFYSISNHSDETLTSELPAQAANGRLLPKAAHSRQTSRSPQGINARPAEPETLMMATVQTTGSFTLDGSLINAAPFEEVKRKGVQTGGGVVGVERSNSKRASGMFGAFSWNNLGESLGGLLGADESKSSMAQMKANVGGKSVPLLSTPQSLLFVDLRLAPGESKSFNYKFQLPRGLPPSHRGRAMKVNYHLSLAIQRPEKHALKHAEIPFRVLGSYNGRGETLGHDLMSPYILLQDAARSSSIAPDPANPSAFPKFKDKEAEKTPKSPKQGLEDFLRYTERLLAEPADAHGALASPTSPSSTRKQSLADLAPTSTKEAVDFAIQRANHLNSRQRNPDAQASSSSNRFNIARSGQPVAILTLLRPAYRLGEPVIGTIDFTAPSANAGGADQAPTYSVLAELESAERIDPSLALRSGSSIQRVTRKIHASSRENAIFARSVGFSLNIPASATPTFETTGVSLVWRVRVEFTVQRQQQQGQGSGVGGFEGWSGGGGGGGTDGGELLEELNQDERGRTLIARERLAAETFEVGVPIRVLGVPGMEVVGDAEGVGVGMEV